MKWLYSTSVGISSDLFPGDVLRYELAKKRPELIDINQPFYPTDGELGMLASMVYEEHRAFPPKETKLTRAEETKLTRADKNRLEKELLDAQAARVPQQLKHFFEREHWTCIFRFLEQDSGYSGAVYVHHVLPQIVIANEGTRTDEHKVADVKEIGSLIVGEATEVAAAVSLMTDLSQVLKAFPFYAVSITGHSLGGWLSLVSTLEAEKLGLHVHTVTFDSPGAMPMLRKRQFEVSSDIGIGSLDIKTILSNVNLVNVCHTHAPGTIRVFPSLQDKTGITEYLLAAHDIFRILEQFDTQGHLPVDRYRIVDNWPSVKPPSQDIKTNTFSFVALKALWRAAKTAMAAGFSEYHAFFAYCKEHSIAYDHPEEWMNILEQGKRDTLAHGPAHYATSEANLYRCRLANLNASERAFFEFLYTFRLNMPQINEWLGEKGFSILASVLQRIEIQKQFVFKVTGEADPHILLKDPQAGEEQYLDKLLNEIRQLIRKFPDAENQIRTSYQSAFQRLFTQVHEVMPEKFEKIIELMQTQIVPSQPTKIAKFKASAGDLHNSNTHFKGVPEDLALKMYEKKLVHDNQTTKQETAEKTKKTIDQTIIQEFKEFVKTMTAGKEFEELLTAFGDMYLNDTHIEIVSLSSSSVAVAPKNEEKRASPNP